MRTELWGLRNTETQELVLTYWASSQKHKALFSTREKAEDACKHNPQYEPFRIEAEPVKHGRWILEAHDERVNYRWNVTAECSECCDEKKEIWAGFFPGVPCSMARKTALISAESVVLGNYCPNCGAKMCGGAENA